LSIGNIRKDDMSKYDGMDNVIGYMVQVYADIFDDRDTEKLGAITIKSMSVHIVGMFFLNGNANQVIWPLKSEIVRAIINVS